MTRCQLCQQPTTDIIDFGRMPLANGFLDPADTTQEYFFQLGVVSCATCLMVQLKEQPSPTKMFHGAYPFFTASSRLMQEHFEKLANEIIAGLKDVSHPFIVELGCNDGTLLQHFARRGIQHLGVEPSTNVAAVARAQGVTVTSEFFSKKLATEILAEQGAVDVLVATNVLCHIKNLNDVFEGLSILLKDNGRLIFEDPYWGDIIEKNSFDQIYDEHYYYFSAHSLRLLAKRYGFELEAACSLWTHGGSLRTYFRKTSQAKRAPDEILAAEERQGIFSPDRFASFRQHCFAIRDALKTNLQSIRAAHKTVVGYGATSKSTTTNNFCGIGPDLVSCVVDSTPLKQGKLTPGTHIPIKAPDYFQSSAPDYALLYAWNHHAEIMKKEAAFTQRGGKWITYFPTVTMTP